MLLRTLAETRQRDWPSYQPELTYMYNKTAYTKNNPYFLMFGGHGQLPIDMTLSICLGTPPRSMGPRMGQ
ncbi:unnamed protein product [Caretta caretta]